MQQTEGFYFPPVKSSLHHNVVCATYIILVLTHSNIQYICNTGHIMQNIAHPTLLSKTFDKKGETFDKNIFAFPIRYSQAHF